MNENQTQIDKLLETSKNVKELIEGDKSIGFGLDTSTIIKLTVGFFIALFAAIAGAIFVFKKSS